MADFGFNGKEAAPEWWEYSDLGQMDNSVLEYLARFRDFSFNEKSEVLDDAFLLEL